MNMLMRAFMSIGAHESSYEQMLVRALTGMPGHIHERSLTSKKYIELHEHAYESLMSINLDTYMKVAWQMVKVLLGVKMLQVL